RGAAEALWRRTAGGEVAAALAAIAEIAAEVERETGDEAPFVADVRHHRGEGRAEIAVSGADDEGNRVGGRNRFGSVDVSQDRGPAPVGAVEGIEGALARERRRLGLEDGRGELAAADERGAAGAERVGGRARLDLPVATGRQPGGVEVPVAVDFD